MILYSLGAFTDHEGRFGEKGTLISPAAGAGATSLRYAGRKNLIRFPTNVSMALTWKWG